MPGFLLEQRHEPCIHRMPNQAALGGRIEALRTARHPKSRAADCRYAVTLPGSSCIDVPDGSLEDSLLCHLPACDPCNAINIAFYQRTTSGSFFGLVLHPQCLMVKRRFDPTLPFERPGSSRRGAGGNEIGRGFRRERARPLWFRVLEDGPAMPGLQAPRRWNRG